MIKIIDFKGRLYNVLEIGLNSTTLLECTATGTRHRVRSYGWPEIGFSAPQHNKRAA